MRRSAIEHRFVECISGLLEDGVLYVSVEYATAVHKCCCGCGERVVTPLTPTDWALSFDGETVSLFPSVGNWSFGCQSHYWIENNKVIWSPRWTRDRIDAERARDRAAKQRQFFEINGGRASAGEAPSADRAGLNWRRRLARFRSRLPLAWKQQKNR